MLYLLMNLLIKKEKNNTIKQPLSWNIRTNIKIIINIQKLYLHKQLLKKLKKELILKWA